MNIRRYLTALLCFALLATGLGLRPAHGQLPEGKLAEKPFVVFWTTGFTEQRASGYIRSVAKDLRFDSEMNEAIYDRIKKAADDEGERPFKGTAMFLVRGLLPSVATFEFEYVKDDAAFQRRVQIESTRLQGPVKPEVTGTGDVRSVEYKRTWQQTVTKVVDKIDDDGNVTGKRTVPVLDEDGKPKTEERSWSWNRYLRKEGNILFLSHNDDSLLTRDLPDLSDIGRDRTDDDAYVDLNPGEIPAGIRSVFWNTLRAAMGSALQQRDNEVKQVYGLRRAVGDIGMNVMEAGINEVSRAIGGVRLANETTPLKAHGRIDIKSNGQLRRDLKQLTESRPRLPVRDDAIATVHSAWAMPDSMQKLVRSFSEFLVWITEDGNSNPAAAPILRSLATMLEGTAEAGDFEAMVKLGGDAESGVCLYGAIRLDRPDQHLEAFYDLLALMDTGAVIEETSSGRKYIHCEVWELSRGLRVPVPEFIRKTLEPKSLFLMADSTALWFALGSPNAYRLVENRISGSSRDFAPSGTLLSFNVNLERVASDLDKDQPIREFVARLENEMDADALRLERRQNGGEVGMEGVPKPRNFAKDVLKRRDAQLDLNFEVTNDGLEAHARVDESLGRLLVARFMYSQNRMMEIRLKRSKLDLEELKTKAAEVEHSGAD